MTELKETRVGLPNTCSECGADVGPSWFAPNDDVARSGGGRCASCAGEQQTFGDIRPANLEVHQLAETVIAAVRDAQGISNERVLRPESAARAEPEAQADIRRAGVAAEDRQTRDALGKKR